MRKTVKIKLGDPIPEGANFLQAVTEIEHGPTRYEWRPTPGIMGVLPIFATESCYEVTPRKEVTYLLYEVET